MGGNGTWHFITSRPELFAAAIPLCGWGNPNRANQIAQMPIWAFHGAADPTVPVAESQKMIAAIRQAGGNPRYTEYKGVGHEVWLKAFQEPGLVEWLFAQHR
jgi:predicted peptidase